ncbi:MAG: hypothetical protein A2667_01855 [Candidatus Wildermuthbacteria bacterium RIFCSPHIGHO2_01_FULL_47_27]|uniref:Transposase IS200-like domain-containing protein n=1 Tax=Candidatus Wildermuthbacteria bacterium RIFCSPHIGHO2_02_FULL_47_17 TaxID=1802452 RepID=A0A1G2R7Z0_9BACT|nr:MAG: hypothetical protein A2667_01855 [Candidatus Wildermuthbacteria bacterium RIFCSPHIGHO2_01_FULL_47_27]OHA68933.1 MAG: hypothetical protein A3D59_00550 [Candidatus Wildermuthbacteria bacterium RIFCSPHIGHO2_02_FULL_47_17]OHA75293.1 MAG: hypothetical protein A3I38_02845 [Candidatus Wildermuthbacteria bacterium RIFCSPLOWO2_02_FULL_47_10]
MPIVYDEKDKWRFLKILRYFNDEYSQENIFRTLDLLQKFGNINPFERPTSWPPRRPLVKILSFHLAENHYHLLLKEIRPGGTTQFMKKLGDGFTGYINEKYHETGRIFQGSYKAKVVDSDLYLQYLDVYIQVFNPIESYLGGIKAALENFEDAFSFALNYEFCSLADSFRKRNLQIIDRDILKEERFLNLKTYKEFARDAILVRSIREFLGKLAME